MGSWETYIWYAGAIVAGALLGTLAGITFSRVVPKGTTRAYVAIVGQGVHGLFYDDEERFWRHYGSIIRSTLGYVGRQLLAVLLAFGPLVLVFAFLGPWAIRQWNQSGVRVVVPSDAGVLVTSDNLGPDRLVYPDGSEIELPSTGGNFAVCGARSFGCTVLQGFGFEAVHADLASINEDRLVIIRSDHGDWNPLWPYLSDPEFLLLISLTLSSIGILFLRSRYEASPESGFALAFVDNALAQLATANLRTLNRLGDLETRMWSRQLARVEIDQPVFITGLARSGTTVLLEKLSMLDHVATHRYRDFPFIMTPILWNRFISLFGARQKAVERPHKDSIEITRDSPDAFEEPIWQYFFPFLHDSTASHDLTGMEVSQKFAKFYTDHVRKILLVRNGTRYVSKGNYNILRIKFINRIFPDARFLIPIRHPLNHVASLVRQHQLFVKYQREDSRVADYLRSVGHYEFGPQRMPICLTPQHGSAITSAWAAGKEAMGYARQWSDLYGYVANLLARDSEIADRIMIVRFEDLCARPAEKFEAILRFTGLADADRARWLAAGIGAPGRVLSLAPEDNDDCWMAVAQVAALFGYGQSPAMDQFSALVST